MLTLPPRRACNPNTPFQSIRTLRLPFSTPRHATIALQVLGVDRELKPDETQRDLSVEGAVLVANFRCVSVRALRTSLSSFMDFVALVGKTVDEFGDKK
ncbi:transcription factor Pcc1-domain-containing protein [Blyttiomyces helicus]|uniref:Transcription factor Pcc1-domain-containing protein n=1 Tax=Blyttiomyces helicus TaxID=388810 RepID=A0A4P9W272_9FUNG|nr:transcription factor Pcc1-domain-containing protein [Blyttiomyces helicus]|eukprot:RKO86311.1 transcription factor Pcc1-domain-containing protein [Blyttiomyces helicus]